MKAQVIKQKFRGKSHQQTAPSGRVSSLKNMVEEMYHSIKENVII